MRKKWPLFTLFCGWLEYSINVLSHTWSIHKLIIQYHNVLMSDDMMTTKWTKYKHMLSARQINGSQNQLHESINLVTESIRFFLVQQKRTISKIEQIFFLPQTNHKKLNGNKWKIHDGFESSELKYTFIFIEIVIFIANQSMRTSNQVCFQQVLHRISPSRVCEKRMHSTMFPQSKWMYCQKSSNKERNKIAHEIKVSELLTSTHAQAQEK